MGSRERGKEWGMYEGGRKVFPYPKTGRIFSLRNGLKRYAREFYVEEKLDGFNARYFLDDGIKGITRGGFLCPYLNDRTLDFVDPRFFDDHPGLVLCGEVVGRSNPYVRECHLPIDDAKFFVFDIMEGKRILGPEERAEILSDYAMEQAPSFGLFSRDDVEKVAEIVGRLDREGREGIVVKDRDGKRKHVKYTTPFSDLSDISLASETLDVHAGYFLQRIMRIAFHDHEFGGNRLEEVGKALSMRKLLSSVSSGKMVSERYRMVVNRKETAERFMEFIRERGTNAKIISMEPYGGKWLVEFERVHVKKYIELSRMLSGKPVFD